MIADLFVIKESRRYGQNGIFAKRFIPKGTLIDFRCRKCKTYSKGDLARLPKKERQFIIDHEVMADNGAYTKFCDIRQLYDNHSCNANELNAHILGPGSNGGVDITVRDIKKGEEVTTDYRLNDGETVHFEGGCRCGARNCMKNSTFRPPASRKLQKFWDTKISEALKRVPYVRQPIKRELLAEHPEIGHLFEKPGSLRIFITGQSGSGKSALAAYLRAHGRNAYDGDLFTGKWVDDRGRTVRAPYRRVGKNITRWAEERKLRWVCDERKFRALLRANRGRELYLVGGPKPEHVERYFDRLYWLRMGRGLALERIGKRLSDRNAYHRFGETEEQRNRIVSDLKRLDAQARRKGYIFVDASMSLGEISGIVTGAEAPKGERKA